MVAAGVAFYAWLALIPLAIALVMTYGFVASADTVTQQLDQLTSSLSEDVATVVQDPIKAATSAGGLGVGALIALAGVLWSASGGMDGLIKGVNIAYDEDPRSFPKRRGLALLLTIGAIVFVILTVALVTVIPAALGNLGLSSVAQVAVQAGRFVLLALLFLGALAVIYRIAPHRDDPEWDWVTPGALVATVLWLLGSLAFSFYVSAFGSYQATYGALAGVIILNLWLFLTSFCILLGAEINSEMEAQTRHDTTKGPDEPPGQRDAVKADEVRGEPTST